MKTNIFTDKAQKNYFRLIAREACRLAVKVPGFVICVLTLDCPGSRTESELSMLPTSPYWLR